MASKSSVRGIYDNIYYLNATHFSVVVFATDLSNNIGNTELFGIVLKILLGKDQMDLLTVHSRRLFILLTVTCIKK